jgi:iron complex outermembrane receptor protein
MQIARTVKTRLGVATLLAATMLAVPAYAAEQVDNKAEETPEIVVTANRREQNILDVPYNISVVSGSDIEAGITLDNAELLRGIPGITAIDQGPRNGAQFNSIRIRGLNVDGSAFGDFAVASVATVSTYVNETPVYANLALIDLERVEVLRGPQGTLYGSGALGGTIKYFLAQPKLGQTSGNVSLTTSSVNGSGGIGWWATGTLNVPIGNTLALRVNISRQDYPGITDYVNLYERGANGLPVQTGNIFTRGYGSTRYVSQKDADTFASWYGRAALLWEPSPDVKFVATYIMQSDRIGGRRQKTQGANGIGVPYIGFQSGAVIPEPSERDFHLGSLEATVDFGFATLTSASSYYDNQGSSETDNTGFYANNFANFYYNYPRPIYTASRTFGDRAFVQEVRLVSNGKKTIDWVVGGFYQKQTRSASQISDLLGFKAWADAFFGTPAVVGTDNVFSFSRTDKFRDFALFGEATWNITENLHLTGGLRWYDNRSDVNTFLRVGAYNSFAGEVTTPFISNDSGVLWKGNVAYNYGDDDLLYATVSTGYRRGGNNGVPTVGRFANDPGWLVFDNDSVTNYEAGLKGTIGGVRYDVSGFYIDWANPQFNTSAPNGAFFTVINGDKARTTGFEAQISGRIGKPFGYSLAYTLVDGKLTRDLRDPINLLVAPAGSPLPGVPRHAINVAADYTWPVSDKMNLVTRVDGFYQSSTQNVLDPGVSQSQKFGGFSIWDATITLANARWSVSLFAKNLFNVEGTTGAFTAAAFGPRPAAEFFGSSSRQFVSLPRTFGLAARFGF